MKQAIEWLNEVGETAMLSAFSGKIPPGIELEHLIGKIQNDAKAGLKVVIEVSGGVAECTECPEGVEVKIVDHDNEKHQ